MTKGSKIKSDGRTKLNFEIILLQLVLNFKANL